jgi:hypothetical protein
MSQKKLFFILLAVVFGIPLLLACLFVVGLIDVDKQLSGPFTVTTQWQEITPTISMLPWKQSQYVSLKIEGVCEPPCAINPFEKGQLTLTDGTNVTPQLQLVDASGKVYDLHVSMIDDRGIGYSDDFPWARYRTVRIRSDHPFRAAGLTWHCHTGK